MRFPIFPARAGKNRDYIDVFTVQDASPQSIELGDQIVLGIDSDVFRSKVGSQAYLRLGDCNFLEV